MGRRRDRPYTGGIGRLMGTHSAMNDDRSIFGSKLDAFVWGALSGVLLILGAALVGRLLWQVVSS